MIILLDPFLFINFSKSDYTKKVLEFIDKYLDVQLEYSKELFKFLSSITFTHSDYLSDSNSIFVLKKIQNLFFDANSETEYPSCDIEDNLPKNFKKTGLVGWDNEFNCFFDYYKKNGEEIIVFLAPENHGRQIKFSSSIYSIEHIYQHAPSNIPLLLFDKKLAKKDSISNPTLDSPLPNKELCKEFESMRDEINKNSLSVKEKEPYWTLYGKEVSERNGYVFNSVITKKNISKKHKRKIFDKEKKIFTSIDFEHGALEICDQSGKWIAEYGYGGNKNPCSSSKKKKNEKNHSIKL